MMEIIVVWSNPILESRDVIISGNADDENGK
jgi:hypothetical protein